MIICPFCEQGAVWSVRLTSTPECEFLMCFECDSVWQHEQSVSTEAGTTFHQYMEGLGRVPDWKDIEKIECLK